MLVIWILLIAFMTYPTTTYNKITYCGLVGLSIAPLIPLCALDWPRKRPVIWQCVLFVATWCYPSCAIYDMWDCGFYRSDNRCGTKVGLSI